jgi:hypothetical protein
VISLFALRSHTTVEPLLDDEARMWTTEGFHASEVIESRERERDPGEKGFEGCERSKMKIYGEGSANRW